MTLGGLRFSIEGGESQTGWNTCRVDGSRNDVRYFGTQLCLYNE